MQYIRNIGTLLSQATNAIIFAGNPDESMSARAHYSRHTSYFWGLVHKVANTVFFWEDDHCANAARTDVRHAGRILRRHQDFMA
jgi:hypothetical protein